MQTTADHIEEYLNNRLTDKEKKTFDERLISDENFSKDVEEHGLLINSMDELQAQELLLRFGKIEQELEGGMEKQHGFPIYLKWAAAVAVLAVLSIAVYLSSGNSNKELFLAYYTPYPNVESPVSRSDVGTETVWQLYEQGNYEAAFKQFEQALVENEADLASRFYLGICALELNQVIVAEEEFIKVAADKEGTYYEQAQWYLALSYLKDGKRKKARSSLEAIIAVKSSYDEKAKALLGELE